MTDIVSPNLLLVSPVDASSMANPVPYLGNNYDKLKAFAVAKPLTSVPDDPSAGYNPGDRIYVSGGTDPTGLYICTGVDPYWGTFWRPMSAQYGPWRRPGPVASPSAIIDPGAASTYLIDDADNPFQYRLTRYGSIQFRGCVKKASGTWADTGGGDLTIFRVIPECIRPGSKRASGAVNAAILIQTAPYPANSSATGKHTTYVYYDYNLFRFNFRIHSNAATITKVFFSGASYPIGDMGFNT